MHRDNSDRYEVQPAPSLAGHKRLGSYLVDAGLINRGQIEVALNDQKVTGMKFGEILVTRGWIKQQTVEYFMAKIVLPERKAMDAGHSSTRAAIHQSSEALSGQREVGDNQKKLATNQGTVIPPTSKVAMPKTVRHSSSRMKPLPPKQSAPNDGVSWVG